MNKKMTVIIPLTILLMACGSNSDQTPPDDKTTKEKILQSKMAPLKKITNGSTPIQKYVHLNNQKFKLLTQEVMMGGKIFNLSTQEKGTIKGSIVVVTESFISIPVVGSKKIAKDTFRLTPDDKKTLHELYKNLIKDEKYTIVELEIDYSPISTTPTM